MPGISANLTPEAYAIWETIHKKEKGNPLRLGRSAFLSEAIIRNRSLRKERDQLLKEKFAIEDKLELMTISRDKLQQIVLERSS